MKSPLRVGGLYSALKVSTFYLLLLLLGGGIGRGYGAQDETKNYVKQTFTYKVAEDCPLKADVYRAPDHVIRPVVLYLHGGALIMQDRSSISQQQVARYVKAGYVVVAIDYRLAPQTKLKGIIEDVQDGYSWVRTVGSSLFWIDPNRIAVVGNSAGGYLTLMAGFCVNPRPKALVSFYGYGDIAGSWYNRPDRHYNESPAVSKEEAYRIKGGPAISEPSLQDNRDRWRFYLYCRQQGLWTREVAGMDLEKAPGALDRYCPIRNVDRDYPPTMLLHGDKDTDVPYQQSATMAEELARHDIEHEFITVPNGGHGFDLLGKGLDDSNTAQIFERVLSFLEKHLK